MAENLNGEYIDNTLEETMVGKNADTIVSKPTKTSKKESRSKSEPKTSKSRPKTKKVLEDSEVVISQEPESLRKEKVVEYDESEYSLREIELKGREILIGPKRLTRFEKARITGARSLQISYGAPLMIKGDVKARSSISLAIEELEKKALPISIRRTLPNGLYQDIPIEWLKT